ncbi:hypothetical protein V2J09_013857 [Rumex salicifolius]
MENHTNSSSSSHIGKPIICKAAVCRKAGEPLVIEEIEVAPPQAWEVRIKIICTSLCHSDVSFWKIDGGPLSAVGKIFGHEAVGVVESVGENVEEMKAGDRVLPVFLPNCGECTDCASTRSNMCSKFPDKYPNAMPRDPHGRFKDADGHPLRHFLSVSSFTEYTVMDVTHVVKISPHIPVEKACLLSCGVTTGVGAAWRVAEVEAGSTVAIFGLGTIGLAVAEGARIRGASKIIGVDLNPDKLELGKKFGVTHFVNPNSFKEKSTSQVIKELTNGGADYCFECIGAASIMQEAFDSSREGWGRTIILGVDLHGKPLNLDCIQILQGRSVMGCFFGGMKHKTDIPMLADKYLQKELSLDGYITHEVDFEDINKAFDYLQGGQCLRCIIWLDKSALSA